MIGNGKGDVTDGKAKEKARGTYIVSNTLNTNGRITKVEMKISVSLQNPSENTFRLLGKCKKPKNLIRELLVRKTHIHSVNDWCSEHNHRCQIITHRKQV